MSVTLVPNLLIRYAHPFLLSDNRHYTFYLWKNVFRRHNLAKYCAIPIYVYSLWCMQRVFGEFCCSSFGSLPPLALCTSLRPTPFAVVAAHLRHCGCMCACSQPALRIPLFCGSVFAVPPSRALWVPQSASRDSGWVLRCERGNALRVSVLSLSLAGWLCGSVHVVKSSTRDVCSLILQASVALRTCVLL